MKSYYFNHSKYILAGYKEEQVYMKWGILVPIVALVLIFGPRLLHEVKDYLLKKEQLKAETELKAEALRLKNSLELEKFIKSDNIFNTDFKTKDTGNSNTENSQNNSNQHYSSSHEKDMGNNADNDDTLNEKRNSQNERN
jgi:hypothetical protein